MSNRNYVATILSCSRFVVYVCLRLVACLVVDDGKVEALEVYRPAFARMGAKMMTRHVFFLSGKSFVTWLVGLLAKGHKTYVPDDLPP
jgi:hypothetical protein